MDKDKMILCDGCSFFYYEHEVTNSKKLITNIYDEHDQSVAVLDGHLNNKQIMDELFGTPRSRAFDKVHEAAEELKNAILETKFMQFITKMIDKLTNRREV